MNKITHKVTHKVTHNNDQQTGGTDKMEKAKLNAGLVQTLNRAFAEHEEKCDTARREYATALNQADREYAAELKKYTTRSASR